MSRSPLDAEMMSESFIKTCPDIFNMKQSRLDIASLKGVCREAENVVSGTGEQACFLKDGQIIIVTKSEENRVGLLELKNLFRESSGFSQIKCRNGSYCRKLNRSPLSFNSRILFQRQHEHMGP